MKKALCMSVIFIFNIAVMAALFVFSALLLVFMLYPLPFVISAMTAAGTVRLFNKLRLKYGISAWVFWILAFLPQLIIGAGAVAVIYVGPGSSDMYGLYALTAGVPYGIFGAISLRLAVKKAKGARI